MHELGIVFHIIKIAEEEAKANQVKHINSVVLEIGEVSGIISDYLLDCWKWAVEKSEMMQGCTLEIETIEGITYCEDCQKTYNTVKYAKKCPHCGSEHTYLKQGNEVNIKEIIVE